MFARLRKTLFASHSSGAVCAPADSVEAATAAYLAIIGFVVRLLDGNPGANPYDSLAAPAAHWLGFGWDISDGYVADLLDAEAVELLSGSEGGVSE